MNFTVFLKKEILEHIKTYKLLIVAAVLLVFGISTPLLIKFLPEILRLSGEQIPIQLPELSARDAIQSYLGNLGQIGLLVVVLVAMGSIAQERERRTAVMTLSKSVGFGSFILAKLVALAITTGVGLLLGAFGCYLYTIVLLGDFNAFDFLIINFLAGYYLLVCLAITVMYSALFRSQLAAGGLALVSLISLAALSGIPYVGQYLPNALMGWATNIVMGKADTAWPALVTGGVLITAALITGWQVLRRKEI